MKLAFIALAAIALAVAMWVGVAGPVTVYRTVVYNFSGIDDYRIFPQRRLVAAAVPFRFHEGQGAGSVPEVVGFGARQDIPLAELLGATETVAFLVLKNDAIVYERYGEGFGRATPSLSFSMGKSILSILVGCALADGYISSIDQPVTDWVPELTREGFSTVTLKHLLQMTSGIDYAENDNPFGIHPRFYYTNRLEQEILQLRMREQPGSHFIYKSGDAALLTLVLQRAMGGKSVTQYTQERLWQPLGMEDDGGWSVDHEPGGLEKTACCLAASTRDFAKLGRLYLNKGRWEGQQIVPQDWVIASTRSNTSEGSAWNYQRMWWLVAQDRPDYVAIGHLGQFLYVNPSTGVIIVRLGRGLGGLSREDWMQVFKSLSDAAR